MLGFVIAILSQISFVDLVNAHTHVCVKNAIAKNCNIGNGSLFDSYQANPLLKMTHLTFLYTF